VEKHRDNTIKGWEVTKAKNRKLEICLECVSYNWCMLALVELVEQRLNSSLFWTICRLLNVSLALRCFTENLLLNVIVVEINK